MRSSRMRSAPVATAVTMPPPALASTLRSARLRWSSARRLCICWARARSSERSGSLTARLPSGRISTISPSRISSAAFTAGWFSASAGAAPPRPPSRPRGRSPRRPSRRRPRARRAPPARRNARTPPRDRSGGRRGAGEAMPAGSARRSPSPSQWVSAPAFEGREEAAVLALGEDAEAVEDGARTGSVRLGAAARGRRRLSGAAVPAPDGRRAALARAGARPRPGALRVLRRAARRPRRRRGAAPGPRGARASSSATSSPAGERREAHHRHLEHREGLGRPGEVLLLAHQRAEHAAQARRLGARGEGAQLGELALGGLDQPGRSGARRSTTRSRSSFTSGSRRGASRRSRPRPRGRTRRARPPGRGRRTRRRGRAAARGSIRSRICATSASPTSAPPTAITWSRSVSASRSEPSPARARASRLASEMRSPSSAATSRSRAATSAVARRRRS